MDNRPVTVAPSWSGGEVTVVVFDAFGGGGVARTTSNLVNQLSHSADVRVISLYRRRAVARYPLDPRVELTVLRDLTRPESLPARLLDRAPTRLRPVPSERHMSALTDLLLRRAIRTVSSGVIVSTRPSLHLATVAMARPEVTTVGWEHLNFQARFHNPRLAQVLRASVPRLDGYVVLTEADAEDYRRELPEMKTRIEVIRNSVSWPLREQVGTLDSKVVVAAGRLVPRKGFRRLVRAFAPVARRHRDWQLHIYGVGRQKAEIAALVTRLGLDGQVQLRGYCHDLPAVMADASVYAMASLSEGFPMVLIEAMSQGLPLIAYDCPRGPGEIIRDGANGILVPNGKRTRFTDGLLRLVEDDELRTRLGRQALHDAEQYTVSTISAQWQHLFETLSRR